MCRPEFLRKACLHRAFPHCPPVMLWRRRLGGEGVSGMLLLLFLVLFFFFFIFFFFFMFLLLRIHVVVEHVLEVLMAAGMLLGLASFLHILLTVLEGGLALVHLLAEAGVVG